MFEHMQKVREELLNTVNTVSEEKFNEKPAQDEWSIAQVVDHLQKIENVLLESLKKSIHQAENKTVEEKQLEAVTDRTRKVPAPEHVSPGPVPIDRTETITALEEARRDLNNFTELLSKDFDLKTRSLRHPVLGEVSIKQWIEFVGYHEERHLLQIKEVKEKISA
ncbi:DinB family protein [Bacillus sp. FJAT-42376]|uniref:DinB family protein n=1 Tax=Bacillus sp. FJAT-42376 TaxID=2014076 RepID=UPI000F50EFDF|nr:DinB family protein [Bacillus sp. FJAT-42376]AZB44123.1 DinB family protein [Bacillus sp. FJAT-42376]